VTAKGPRRSSSGILHGLNPRVVRGFSLGAEAYERARPEYPATAVQFVARTFDLGPGKIAVDVAAGTGKWTRRLVETGATVIAVEPLPAMRQVFERSVPGIPVMPGTAEATGLPNASVDLVTVAQAFHWFSVPLALQEFRRILRPGGGLAIIWNVRKEASGWRLLSRRLLDEYRPRSYGHFSGKGWKKAFTPDSGFTRLRVWRYANEQILDRATIEDRYRSLSFVSAMPRRRQDEFLRRLGKILDHEAARSHSNEFTIPYDGKVYWSFLRGPAGPKRRLRSLSPIEPIEPFAVEKLLSDLSKDGRKGLTEF
jgi:ubiquinone/menaquinone biosynthesis C-methylase UbiE